MNALKIILVDDNLHFRKALSTLLIKEYQAEIIGEASNADEFRALENINLADIILMDVMMPGTDGITLAKETFWKNPKLKILAITMHIDRVYLLSLIEVGFRGCVNKSRLFEEIHTAIKTVIDGKIYFPGYISIYK